jgi:hypothetical protein
MAAHAPALSFSLHKHHEVIARETVQQRHRSLRRRCILASVGPFSGYATSTTYALLRKNMIAAITRTSSKIVPTKPKPIAASICLSFLSVSNRYPYQR